jgi:hypothetical protein
MDHLLERAPAIDPTLTSDEFAALLTESRPAPLGSVRLIVPWGSGVQWLPSDDRIVALDVRITRSSPGTVEASAHLVQPITAS